MTTVVMNASAIGGTLNLPFTGQVVVPANGIITVDARDGLDLLRDGATYVRTYQRATYFQSPRNGSAGRIVASTALANGTLTIANQVNVPRQLSVLLQNGAGAPVTAGNLALTYVANDGTVQVDNFSCVLASSGTATISTSKGVQVMTASAAIVTGIVGGSSPNVQIADTNSLSAYVNPGFAGFALSARGGGRHHGGLRPNGGS